MLILIHLNFEILIIRSPEALFLFWDLLYTFQNLNISSEEEERIVSSSGLRQAERILFLCWPDIFPILDIYG